MDKLYVTAVSPFSPSTTVRTNKLECFVLAEPLWPSLMLPGEAGACSSMGCFMGSYSQTFISFTIFKRHNKMAFVPGRLIQPNLICVGEARAYPSEATFRSFTLRVGSWVFIHNSLFFSQIFESPNKALFVTFKLMQPSLIFVSRAGAYPSEAHSGQATWREFTAFHFLCNLQKGPICLSDGPWHSFPAQCNAYKQGWNLPQ